MTEAVILDTRHLTEGDRQTYVGDRLVTLAPSLLHGWVAYCPKHDLGLRLATRDEARKGRETGGWCYGCIEEAKRPEETDLSQLRYAQSQECGCMRAWPSIRLGMENGVLLPRCEGCGAVPGFFHWVTDERSIDRGGETARLLCSCGHRAEWGTDAENHAAGANRANRFEHIGYGRFTRRG